MDVNDLESIKASPVEINAYLLVWLFQHGTNRGARANLLDPSPPRAIFLVNS